MDQEASPRTTRAQRIVIGLVAGAVFLGTVVWPLLAIVFDW